MTEAELKGYSKKNKYKYKDQTTKDVLGAILKFKDLKLLVDSLIENNGQATKLICLDGTIPINSMGTTYNIPVRVWLRPDYPSRPPICYVRPTQNMSIRVSRHVDKSGLIYLRYLREWEHPNCHLSGVIEAMCTAFGEKLPVWQKPSGQAPQRPLSSPPGVHRILLHRALPALPPGATQEWPLEVTDITAGLQNREKDSSSKELVQLKSQIEQISAERDSLVKQNADINRQLLDLQDDNGRLTQQLTEISQQLAVAQQTSDELDRLKRRYSTLEKAHNQCQPELLHDSFTIPVNDVLLSRTNIGGGSYGAVEKGLWRGIPVAVKQFHDVLRQGALRVTDYHNKLFRQELSTCAKLHHPNIVTFCGATLEKDTPLQIVMELLEGSLEELIKVAKDSDFYLTHREQVHLAEGTTAGITYLHQLQPKPYVHCDIRPSNILVSRDMSAKVGDLGASHIVGASTSAGPLSGNYIAPERMGGEGQRSESSPSSDVYSLGVTLTDLFTGEAAVSSKRDQQLAMIAIEYLQDLCIEATLAIPGERPSAAHMLVRLQQQKSANEFLCCPIRRLVLGKVEGDRMRLVAMQ